MPKSALISDPSKITSDWLTRVLHLAGIDGEVKRFTATSIGTGQVGENVRFTLEGPGNLPKTVVGKFPSPDPLSRETGISTSNYRREVHFYLELKPRVKIQTPDVLFADVNDETHDFVIIMEDLAPGEPGDQLAGCGIAATELAMEQLAHLHGPVWGDESVTDNELIANRQANPTDMKELYDLVSPGFLDRYGTRLTNPEKDMVRLIGENLVAFSSNYKGNQTLIHIDYRDSTT